jgi:hypothetical protein
MLFGARILSNIDPFELGIAVQKLRVADRAAVAVGLAREPAERRIFLSSSTMLTSFAFDFGKPRGSTTP